MSSTELAPFFPSATHPALPIAAGLLSSLRALTAPGKGNDLKPEERAALVGVSALLGCERAQSHDLPESTAQRLASVAPAHFRSALAAARRLLASERSTASPRSSRSQTQSQSQSQPTPERSPFNTPKKKYKYSSSVDISGLLTPHRAGAPSPLRQSVTPSKRREKMPGVLEEAEEEEEDHEDDGEDPLLLTPTKRRPRQSMQEKLSAARRSKEQTGQEAFLAMRPGASDAPEEEQETAAVQRPPAPPVAHYDPFAAQTGKIRKLRQRSDWTYRERVWGVPPAADAWRRLGVDVSNARVPELIVTDDEEGGQRTPQRTTPKSTKKTPRSSGKRGRRSTAPRLDVDGIIVAAWA